MTVRSIEVFYLMGPSSIAHILNPVGPHVYGLRVFKWLRSRVMFLRTHRFARKVYDCATTTEKALGLLPYRLRWPPFLATENLLFQPRFKVLVINYEEALNQLWIELDASRLPDEITHLAKVDGPWHPIARAADGLPWRKDEERRYKLKPRRDAFQTEGRYALRYRVVEVGPASKPIQMSEGISISHGSTQTIASSTVMHHFKVHPASLSLSFLAFVVGSLIALISLLATVVFT